MVKKSDKLLKRIVFFNPLVISSVIFVLLLYGNILSVKQKYDEVPVYDISGKFEVSGTIISNPVKTQTNRFYSVDFCVDNLKCKKNGLELNRNIQLKAFIPSECVEAYYPGKLFTSINKKSAAICEQGANLLLKGKFIDKSTFIAENIVQRPWKKTFSSRLAEFRAKNRINFKRIMFAWGSAGGLLMALLTGMKEYTESEVSENFRLAGLSHILALSGMHLNLFSGIAKKIEILKLKKSITYIFQILAILIFVWFAGLSPSLFRAALCSILAMLCSIINLKQKSMIEILAAAFLIHISIKPYEAFELSFILSYGALAGILIFSEIASYFSSSLPAKLAKSLGSSAGAQSITAPVCLKQMGSFAFCGIISTIVVSPLITVFIYLGLILIILCLIFPGAVGAGAFLMKILYTFICRIVGFFSTLPSINLQE